MSLLELVAFGLVALSAGVLILALGMYFLFYLSPQIGCQNRDLDAFSGLLRRRTLPQSKLIWLFPFAYYWGLQQAHDAISHALTEVQLREDFSHSKPGWTYYIGTISCDSPSISPISEEPSVVTRWTIFVRGRERKWREVYQATKFNECQVENRTPVHLREDSEIDIFYSPENRQTLELEAGESLPPLLEDMLPPNVSRHVNNLEDARIRCVEDRIETGSTVALFGDLEEVHDRRRWTRTLFPPDAPGVNAILSDGPLKYVKYERIRQFSINVIWSFLLIAYGAGGCGLILFAILLLI